ncbi:ATP dependent DNA ligase [Stackebrandtia nassauensis DSM 44728]|uniref:DNA ligase (ATP) n=2 Tax=Stackebrandtia TaxID=283810 RepID=D3Q8B6_STANL|nr:ATP dependent DNA ligase [Stackebrandtia nassauensis DSM 44728]
MLPTPGTLPEGPGWGFEFKWDGMRTLIATADGRARMIARGGGDYASAFPDLADIADQLPEGVIDAEIIALDASARPSFSRVAKRFSNRHPPPDLVRSVPVNLMIFDLLRLGDAEVVGQPYWRRREVLDALELVGERWLVPPWHDDGAGTLAAALDAGLEGVVAKRLDSRYVAGRSRDWVKVKAVDTGDVVVGGWRTAIRSLLVGTPNAAGTLTYRGRVGSGLTDAELGRFRAELAPSDACPFDPPPPGDHARDAIWTAPVAVVEVAFSHLTRSGLMRHPRYVRARPDKTAADIDPAAMDPGASDSGPIDPRAIDPGASDSSTIAPAAIDRSSTDAIASDPDAIGSGLIEPDGDETGES